MKATILYYKSLEENSDKEYRLQLVKKGTAYVVLFQYGRRAGTLTAGTKTPTPVSLEEAERVYDKLVREKMSKGYIGAEAGTAAPLAPTPIEKADASRRTPYPQEKLEEIGREEAELLVKDDRYFLQLKANGHFRQAEKLPNGTVISYNKKGEAKEFPAEVEKDLAALPLKTFFFDGELVGTSYVVFQILQKNGTSLKHLPYKDRLGMAMKAISDSGSHIKPIATWEGTKAKQAGLALLRKTRCEGACFKRKDAIYRSGGGKKYKFLKTITCKVMELGTKGHVNARLGLLKDGKWIEVGGASMIGKNKNIKVGSLVEVTFLYFTGSRLYQPRIIELRDDVNESECTFKQQIKASMYQEGVEAA